jgi:eukaryotic-like serine/threonine-protein kinase
VSIGNGKSPGFGYTTAYRLRNASVTSTATDEKELNRRAHALLSEALDLEPEQRPDFVRQACAEDAALLSHVMSMLKVADQAGSFLEEPVFQPIAASQAALPDAIGNYLIVGVLGQGGMATVFEAVQEHPKRRVALKVMKQSVLSDKGYARFRFEAEVLAKLHHPAIAQIYEAGAAPIGSTSPSPFFAMELVSDARPITEYAENGKLDLSSRLEMFAVVCDAVHHGHQHGVIHRDIKPANVLVDGSGRPKVIDFGIAKMTGGSSETTTTKAATALTQRHQLIGTLQSMSPEQCNSSQDIDSRTDVYSLGTLLYQLITGTKPHDFSGCSIPEAVRMIAEVEPIKPREIIPEAQGDLEAIVSMAMHKDREHRYSSAAALGADIRRYLMHLPVEARSPSKFELAKKFFRRNRLLVYVSTAAVLALMIASIASTRLAYLEYRARQASEVRQKQLETVTEFQESLLRDLNVVDMGERMKQAYQDELDKALSDSKEVNQSSEQEVKQLTDSLNYTSLAVRTLKESVLQHYLDSIRSRFAEEPTLQSQLLQRLAQTMHELGLHNEAEEVLRETLKIRRNFLGNDHEETLVTLHALGSQLSFLRRHEEAVVLLREAYLGRIKRFGIDHEITLRTGTTLGGVLRYQGKLAEAEKIWEHTLKTQQRVLGHDHDATLRTLNNMGVVYATQGRLDEAEACWRELLERRRRTLGDNHASTRSVLGNLCLLLQDQGKVDELRELLSLVENNLAADRQEFGDLHSNTLMTMGQLAALLTEKRDFERAEKLLREFLAGREKTLGPENSGTLLSMFALSENLFLQERFDESMELIKKALAMQRRNIGSEHEETIDSISLLSRCLQRRGELQEALKLSQEAVNAALSTLPPTHWKIGWLLSNHGELLAEDGDLDAAKESFERGLKLLETSLGETHPKVELARERLRRLAETKTDKA